MFAIIFFRLWYLQVLSGDNYVAEANDNRVREIKVRGAARARSWTATARVLVDNRTGLAVKVTPDKLPEDRRPSARELYGGSASCSALKPAPAQRRDRARAARRCRSRPPTVKQDVSPRHRLLPARAPGRVPRRRASSASSCASTRTTTIGAHLFGTVGEVTEEQLKDPRYRGVSTGRPRRASRASSTEYDRFLRGRNGAAASRWTRSASLQRRARPACSPMPGPAAAAVDRPGRAAGGPAGARRRHRQGRLRR